VTGHSRDALPRRLPFRLGDAIPAGVLANRSTFYQELTTPFFGANRPGAKVSQGMRDQFWFQGMQGGLKAQYDTCSSWELDYSEDARGMDVPALVIHGDDDQIVPIDATGRRAAELIPNARLIVYPGGRPRHRNHRSRPGQRQSAGLHRGRQGWRRRRGEPDHGDAGPRLSAGRAAAIARRPFRGVGAAAQEPRSAFSLRSRRTRRLLSRAAQRAIGSQ
jgi:hypothetical protein